MAAADAFRKKRRRDGSEIGSASSRSNIDVVMCGPPRENLDQLRSIIPEAGMKIGTQMYYAGSGAEIGMPVAETPLARCRPQDVLGATFDCEQGQEGSQSHQGRRHMSRMVSSRVSSKRAMLAGAAMTGFVCLSLTSEVAAQQKASPPDFGS